MNDCDEEREPRARKLSCAIIGHRWFGYRCWDTEQWRLARVCTSCGWNTINKFGEWVGFDPRRLRVS